MAGEKEDKLDIIDAAMVNDDTDYGDGASADTGNEGDDAGDTQQQQPSKTDAQQQPTDGDKTPGRVPDTGKTVDLKAGQQPGPTQNKRVGSEFMDGKGNIVDKDGKVIAPAGASSRLWMEASRATALASNLTRQLEQRDRTIQQNSALISKAKEIAELPQKLGVSEEDYREGITLMRDWRADPVKVAREVVARTLSFGHNLSDILGKNAGDAIEMKALTALIQKTTAPIEEARVNATKTAEANATAEANYNAFVNAHEYAEVHGEAIANLMKNRGVQPEVAYYQVKMFAMEHGLDFAEPLGPQIVALKQQQQNGDTRTNNGQRQTAPMLNGNARGNDANLTSQREYARADDDWGSILKDVMGSTG